MFNINRQNALKKFHINYAIDVLNCMCQKLISMLYNKVKGFFHGIFLKIHNSKHYSYKGKYSLYIGEI